MMAYTTTAHRFLKDSANTDLAADGAVYVDSPEGDSAAAARGVQDAQIQTTKVAKQAAADELALETLYDKSSPSYEGGSLVRGDFQHGVIVKDVKTRMSYYTFQFNPSEMSGGTQANWKLYSGASGILPIASFLHMNSPTMELELFVDCTDISKRRPGGENDSSPLKVGGEFLGVWADILAVLMFVNPNVLEDVQFQAQGRYCAPAPVIVCMGPVVTRSVLTAVDWKIVQWFQNLVPSRATIKVSFTGITSTFEGDFENLKNTQKDLQASGLVPAAKDASTLYKELSTKNAGHSLQKYGDRLFLADTV